MARNTLSRSLHDVGLSAWFGGTLANAVALNAAAGSDVWAFVPSPAPEARPANEDVIRLAFIYKKAVVEVAGDSTILTGSAAFSNARQPLAQAFRPVGGDADTQQPLGNPVGVLGVALVVLLEQLVQRVIERPRDVPVRLLGL